jgi:RimJ/RimL family protein N-acetyltransferase
VSAPPPLPVRTARLLLRTAEPGDLDAVRAYWGDPEVTRYLPFDTLDRAGALARLGRYFGSTDPQVAGDALFLVVEHEGRVIGDVMLRLKTGEPPGVAEIGWVFDPAAAGRGLATESAAAVVDLALGHYGCHRVEAQLDPDNERSAALCRRLGMRQEAHLRRDWFGKGRWGDTAIFGLLREEWSGAPRPPGPVT